MDKAMNAPKINAITAKALPVNTYNLGRLFLLASTGAALSTVGWHGEGAYWPILLFWGVFIAYGRTPAGIFVGVTGYYLAPSWAAVLAINTALDHSIFASLLLWLAHGAINAAAWTILPVIFYLARILTKNAFFEDRSYMYWSAVIGGGLLLTLTPPFSSLSWGNPSFIVGYLYPGSGGVGVGGVFLAWIIVLAAWCIVSQKMTLQKLSAVLMYQAARITSWGGKERKAGYGSIPRPSSHMANIASNSSLRPIAAALALALTASVYFNLSNHYDIDQKAGHKWINEDTALDSPKSAELFTYKIKEALSRPENRGRTIVFPESALSDHMGNIEQMMRRVAPMMRENDARVAFHAIIPSLGQEDFIANESRTYNSAILVYGDQGLVSVYRSGQLIPAVRGNRIVPWAGGVPILKEKGRAHVVAAICYESLLLTHWLRAWMATRGSVASHIVVVSSIWFVDGAAGEKTDRLMRLHALRASKMLGLPFINAVNRAPPNNKTNGRF